MFKNFEITEDNADMVAVGLLAWCAFTGVVAGLTAWHTNRKMDKEFEKIKKMRETIESVEI